MRAWSSYPTSAFVGGSSAADGSITAPYQATGADASAVLSALAALSAANGAYAAATITGSAPRLMQYVSADSAWYATDGGDGSQLAPFWTASTGEDGIDALPAAAADAYGVIGKGSGSPQSLRRLTLVADGWASAVSSTVGQLQGPLLEWVTPTIHAFGTPSTVYGVERTTSPFTATVGSGGAVDYGVTVAGRVSVKSGSAAASTLAAPVAATTSSRMLCILSRVTATGISTASGSNSVVRMITSSDSGQYLGIAAGGTAASNATEWHAPNASAALVTTGIAIATEKRLDVLLTISTNTLSIYVNGSATAAYSAASVATTGTTTAGTIIANPQGGASVTMRLKRAIFCEWN